MGKQEENEAMPAMLYAGTSVFHISAIPFVVVNNLTETKAWEMGGTKKDGHPPCTMRCTLIQMNHSLFMLQSHSSHCLLFCPEQK